MTVKDLKDLMSNKDLSLPLEAELWINNGLYKVVSLWDGDTKSGYLTFPSMGRSYGSRHGVKCECLFEQTDMMSVFVKEFDNKFIVTDVNRFKDRIVLIAKTNFIKELL